MTAKGAPMFVESAVTIKEVWTPRPHETAIELLEDDEARRGLVRPSNGAKDREALIDAM
jgi:hypothetical protein